MPTIWTIASGAGELKYCLDEAERDQFIVDTIKSYKSNPGDEGMTEELMAEIRAEDPDSIVLVEVTIDNWRDVLARLNQNMDEMGEAHYLCTVEEEEISPEKAAVITALLRQEQEEAAAAAPGMR